MRRLQSLLASALLVTVAGSCTDVPEDEDVFEPKGVMKGTVTYMGPLPCSENGHVVGNAVLTIFNVNALPPPTGLGLSAHRIAVVPGDVLFAGVADKIPVGENGALACPPEGTMVQVSASWEVGPVDPGKYQVRGWFDLDGDWHAAFKFANMVSKGDIGGGAIANISEALSGGNVIYTEIEVGVDDGNGNYVIPEDGYVTRNVSPILAARIPTNRPYFHVSEMRRGGDESGVPDPIPNPSDADVMIPADFHIYDAGLTTVQDSLYWFRLQSGLPEPEQAPAMVSPFFFRLGDPLILQRYDANKDGVIDGDDHVTGSPVPALAPIVSMTKLDRENDSDNLWRTTQDKPRVLTSLVVAPPDLESLIELFAYADKDPEPVESIKAFARPSAVCIEDPADPSSRTVIVTPYEMDQVGNPAISNVPGTKADIADQLSRSQDSVEIVYGCLPPGRFAINAIYPETGQAWTLPNESGLCMPGEKPGDGSCGKRVKLASQFRTFEVGPAVDPASCQAMRKPLNEPDLIRDYCLTPSERERYIDGTLWGGGPNPL